MASRTSSRAGALWRRSRFGVRAAGPVLQETSHVSFNALPATLCAWHGWVGRWARTSPTGEKGGKKDSNGLSGNLSLVRGPARACDSAAEDGRSRCIDTIDTPFAELFKGKPEVFRGALLKTIQTGSEHGNGSEMQEFMSTMRATAAKERPGEVWLEVGGGEGARGTTSAVCKPGRVCTWPTCLP